MPIVRTSKKPLKKDNRPDWCQKTAAGIFCVSTIGGTFDCHFHDCDEYWLIFKGKAKIITENQTHYVKSGDIVCTAAGEEHDVIEIYEDLEAFYFEDTTPEGGKIGHLHRDEKKTHIHPVPSLPIPKDFPS